MSSRAISTGHAILGNGRIIGHRHHRASLLDGVIDLDLQHGKARLELKRDCPGIAFALKLVLHSTIDLENEPAARRDISTTDLDRPWFVVIGHLHQRWLLHCCFLLYQPVARYGRHPVTNLMTM